MGICLTKCSCNKSLYGEIVVEKRFKDYDSSTLDFDPNPLVLQAFSRGYLARKRIPFKIYVLGQLLSKQNSLPWRTNVMDGDGIYTGQMLNNHKNGLGKLLLNSGDTYSGYFQLDLYHGMGKLYTKEFVYEGEWFKGKKQGFGIYYNDKVKYSGNWDNDFCHGLGTETWEGVCVYTGTFFYGKKQGQGRCQFSNLSYYSGNFFDNQFSGSGEFLWENGKKYIGEWKNNLMHGYGTIVYSDGSEFKGHFKNGKKNGNGELKKKGFVKKTAWKNGKKVKCI
jgi:hypothetical protein